MADPEIMAAIVAALNEVVRENDDKALAQVVKAAHLLAERRTRSTRRGVLLALLEGVRGLIDQSTDGRGLDAAVDELPYVRLCQRRFWFFGAVETVHTIDVVPIKLDVLAKHVDELPESARAALLAILQERR